MPAQLLPAATQRGTREVPRGCWRRTLAALAAPLALLAAGCTLLPTSAPGTRYPPGLPPRAELTQVPFFAQDQYQCGPAALAAALGYAGVARTPQQLVDQVYVPQRQGSLQPEMLAATRRAGLIAYPLEPQLGAILREIAGGNPVVVLQNLRFDLFPSWHYALVVGYDLDRHELVLRSGTEPRLVLDERDFERSWTKAGQWAFIAVPRGQLPVTATEDEFVAAAASLERASPEDARAAYQLALYRWPDDLAARIGLGNVAYAQHRLAEAQAHYQRAAQTHAGSGDAWNNLAQVLHELGREQEALACALRAVAIGGPRQANYRETLQSIQTAPAR